MKNLIRISFFGLVVFAATKAMALDVTELKLENANKVVVKVRFDNGSISDPEGKRIATMDYDKAAPVMVDRVGAIMVPADLGSIGPKFNNGDVDACYVSAPAYAPFELHRGLGANGGVIKYPIAQATLQLMVRHEKFPEAFGTNVDLVVDLGEPLSGAETTVLDLSEGDVTIIRQGAGDTSMFH